MDGLWGKCMDGMDGVPHRESTSVLVQCTIIRTSVCSVVYPYSVIFLFFLIKNDQRIFRAGPSRGDSAQKQWG